MTVFYVTGYLEVDSVEFMGQGVRAVKIPSPSFEVLNRIFIKCFGSPTPQSKPSFVNIHACWLQA